MLALWETATMLHGNLNHSLVAECTCTTGAVIGEVAPLVARIRERAK